MEDKNAASLNRCLTQLTNIVDKLQNLGVLTNVTYCIAGSPNIFTKGWGTISKLTLNMINQADKEFTAQLEKDFKDTEKGENKLHFISSL